MAFMYVLGDSKIPAKFQYCNLATHFLLRYGQLWWQLLGHIKALALLYHSGHQPHPSKQPNDPRLENSVSAAKFRYAPRVYYSCHTYLEVKTAT